jgi:hypothetical protein
MAVDFGVLESQLSETEMALFIAVDVAMNAALLAGADPELMIAHLEQHERNFGANGQRKAAHMMAALAALRRNAAGGHRR